MIRLAVLGGLAVLNGDAPVAGAAGRGRNVALLALIDSGGESGIHRDRLVALLWPDSDQPRARHSLDQAVYTLRRAFGADVFVDVSGGLALNRQHVESDVAAFRIALGAADTERAVRLYGGPFLDGFHISRAGEFERWVDSQRAELEELYVRALEALAREAAAAGDHALASDRWARLAAAQPLSSRVALELMRALEQAGDRTKALDVAAAHEALVRDELGTRPDPAVLTFIQELRLAPGPTEADAEHVRLDAPAPQLPPNASAPQRAVPSAAQSRDRRTSRVPRVAALFTVMSVLAAAGVISFAALFVVASTRGDDLRDSGSSAPSTLPLVAVSVFENETGDPAFAALGRMAADWIAEGLVRTGLVRVVGPEAHGAHAANAHVTHVANVEGRLYRVGDSIVMRAAIRDPSTGEVIRALDPLATHVTAPERALEPLRQRLIGAMGTLYDVRISTFAQSTLRPPSFEAYRAFAAGLDRYSARDLPGMAAQIRRAVDIDSDYLTARLWLAWTASLISDFALADSIVTTLRGDRDRMSPVERAWYDRQRALLAGDNQRSYEAAVRMADLAPRSGWVIALADAALTINRPREAIAVLENAGLSALGPTRDHAASLLTLAYHVIGDYERELEVTGETVRAIGLDWDFNSAGVEPTVWRARIAAVLDEDERALRLLHQAFAEGQYSRLRWALHTSRDFDGLRGNRGFRFLVERS